jgi:hypothetical protein
LGHRSWIYREGKTRTVYALETTADFLNELRFKGKSTGEKIAYIRGYFDAEGGIPHSITAPLYIQLCQKNRQELQELKAMLQSLGIRCGKIHNPSKRVDPHYWRFYISASSRSDFMRRIGSWHPMKRKLFQERMMI